MLSSPESKPQPAGLSWILLQNHDLNSRQRRDARGGPRNKQILDIHSNTIGINIGIIMIHFEKTSMPIFCATLLKVLFYRRPAVY